jgi:hypothetical protein
MKKILITALIFVLIGAVFCGVAYAVGEQYVGNQLSNSSKNFSAGEINKININDYVAEVMFFKSNNTNDISVKAENIIIEDFKCEVVNDTLKISYNHKNVRIWGISIPSGVFNWKNRTPVINIYIPEGKVFDEIYYGGGVGRIVTEELNAKSLIIAGGVGDYNIDNMTVGRLEIGGGVGAVKIHGVVNGNTKIEGGVGEVKIWGQLNGDVRLHTGVGSAYLDLTGDVGDYNIKASTGIGTLKLNGNHISGSYQSNGKYNLNIDAGVGSIDINIK